MPLLLVRIFVQTKIIIHGKTKLSSTLVHASQD